MTVLVGPQKLERITRASDGTRQRSANGVQRLPWAFRAHCRGNVGPAATRLYDVAAVLSHAVGWPETIVS